MLGEKVSRALKPDAQAFDKVIIKTVPRYKTSGMSGDEWRISASIEFYRKGKLVHECGASNVQNACYLVGARHMEACDNAKGFFAGEGTICDQEGCESEATITLQLKKEFCRHGTEQYPGHKKPVRMFCDKHKTRGDCGLEDADSNYTVISPT
jgi:hypothetical protein